jgi:hypothetical protein
MVSENLPNRHRRNQNDRLHDSRKAKSANCASSVLAVSTNDSAGLFERGDWPAAVVVVVPVPAPLEDEAFFSFVPWPVDGPSRVDGQWAASTLGIAGRSAA